MVASLLTALWLTFSPTIAALPGAIALGDTELTESSPRTATMQVEGVSCASCTLRIREALLKLAGVSAVRAGDSKSEIAVDFDLRTVKPAKLVECIADAGFKASIEAIRKRG